MVSITVGSLTALLFVTQFVTQLEPWYVLKYMLPLGGMVFANAMNTVCLATERFEADVANSEDYETMHNTAFQAAMIPSINMLFAAGAAALPGVMTGQILAGVEPLIAVCYQVMILCMLLGTTGLSTACYLRLSLPAGANRGSA